MDQTPPETDQQFLRRYSGLLVPHTPETDLERGPELEVFVPVTAEALGVNIPATFDAVVEIVSRLRFEPTMRVLSLMLAHLFHHERDRTNHLALARDVFSPDLYKKVEAFVREDDSHLVFDPRILTALQRLVVVFAIDEPAPLPLERDFEQLALLATALVTVGAALPDASPIDETDLSEWAMYLVRNGVAGSGPGLFEAAARSHAWFVDVHSSRALRDHPARCDLEDWMSRHYGLTLAEQLGIGLAAAAATKALDPSLSAGERLIELVPGFLMSGNLASASERAVEHLSATRAYLADILGGAKATPSHVAWGHAQFDHRPFLVLGSGNLLLTSTRALVSWLTSGWHFRALEAARKESKDAADSRKLPRQYLTYLGAIGEEAVRRLFVGSQRGLVDAHALRVHGDFEYEVGKLRHRSPDVVLDYGSDLVLVEIYSGRMGYEARVADDSEGVIDYVDRAVGRKLKQLGTQTEAFCAGDLTTPDLAPGLVERVWPVVVVTGDPVMVTPMLWSHLGYDPADRAGVPPVQRAIVMNLGELEMLLGHVEHGHHWLPDLLADFDRSRFRHSAVADWLADRFVTRAPYPSYVDQQGRAALTLGTRALFPSAEPFRPQP
ncbi:MAG: hypothetical protein J7513_11405 [Solirubrobacteraceae bacterium]|nr:hypothetical protein [Solirubrobacteraceae bacterium]